MISLLKLFVWAYASDTEATAATGWEQILPDGAGDFAWRKPHGRTLMSEPVELAAQVMAGDRTSEAALCAYFERPLQLMLQNRLGDPQAAEDVTQEVLMIVLSALREGRLDSPSSVSAYVRRTAHNLALKYFRSRYRDVGLAEVGGEESLVAQAPSPVQVAVSDEQHALLEQLLRELKMPRDRELLTGFYLRDTDRDTLCQQYDVTPIQLSRLLHRARERLKALIQARDIG